MKSKKRHHTSSEESEESERSIKSSSSSGSESDESSMSHRHKKKRKRDSSESESETDDQKRTKKRKHKKKKKKHGKKKRRSNSVESISAEELSSVSEGEISSKKKRKHKHKHSKRARSSSASADEDRVDRRLHSVVKERRASSEDGSQPSRTYYQREYQHSASGDDSREREVQRFYRGSSKERRQQYQEQYQYERERNDKYTSYQDKNDRQKYGQSAQYNSNEDYGRRQREYDEYKRHQRFEERRSPDEYHRRPREEAYHTREDPRGYNHNHRFNQYEDRGPKRREYDDGRDYQQRRAPPEPDRYQNREREYQERKERYQERYNTERPRDIRRERPTRPEKPPVSQHREQSKSKSPEDRYRERNRRSDNRGPENRQERDERYRDNRGEERERRDRPARSTDRKEESERPAVKSDARPRERRSRFEAEDNKEYSWGKTEVKKEEKDPNEKEKPNFGLSGKLTADTNTVNGVVIKYSEPDDAKQPKRKWRFYPFKGDKALPILYIHRQSAFLIGRDKKVCDITLEHPSISKQHSALQYRATPFNRPDGTQGRRVRPYIIDLESANGTFVNNKKIESRRYVELLERDVVKFGFSQREYVLLHENSKDDAQDDDNREPTCVGVTTTDQIKLEKRAKQEVAEDGE